MDLGINWHCLGGFSVRGVIKLACNNWLRSGRNLNEIFKSNAW